MTWTQNKEAHCPYCGMRGSVWIQGQETIDPATNGRQLCVKCGSIIVFPIVWDTVDFGMPGEQEYEADLAEVRKLARDGGFNSRPGLAGVERLAELRAQRDDAEKGYRRLRTEVRDHKIRADRAEAILRGIARMAGPFLASFGPDQED